MTAPYSKVTNVDVTQGPVQRLYGVGSVHVQTAGAGGAPRPAEPERAAPGDIQERMLAELKAIRAALEKKG